MLMGHDDAAANETSAGGTYTKTAKCVSKSGELLMMDYKDFT